jgi:phosphoribosyl 1,2-cyclic phosphate phosphodiesterase
MKITLLGTGDSVGTPKIGCNCRTCREALGGGRTRRTRFSIMLEYSGRVVLVDTSPDLRWQLIRNGVSHVDAVIWTHSHYDHYAGFGDFYRVQNNVDVYGEKKTLDYILHYLHFMSYVRHDVELLKPFRIGEVNFTLFPVTHYCIGTPCGIIVEWNGKKLVISGDTNKKIPDESLKLIKNPDVFIVDAIVPPEYKVKKHMNAEEAMELSKEIGAKKTILTHLSHLYLPHDEASEIYPLGYDQMVIEL